LSTGVPPSLARVACQFIQFQILVRILPELAKRIFGHLPAIRLNADETGTGLDFVDQASVVIAHVIDSAADRSRT
jgi:hypothetical protein